MTQVVLHKRATSEQLHDLLLTFFLFRKLLFFLRIFRHCIFPSIYPFQTCGTLIAIENLRNFLRNERCDSTKAKELIFADRMLIVIDSCTNYALARNSRIQEGGGGAIDEANE